MEYFTAFIELVKALSTAAWPGMVIFVIYRYRQEVANLIQSAQNRKFTIKVGGQELSMEEANHQQQNFIADLQKRLIDLEKKVGGLTVLPEVDLLQVSSPSHTGAVQTNAVLWVDDNPKNNSYFIELLQSRGYRIDLAISTSDALSKLSKVNYRLILSDMGRFESGKYIENAGINLLKKIREMKIEVPYIFFCSSRKASQFQEEAKTFSKNALTSSPTKLRAILEKIAPDTTI
jgi:CheY-like chemotaxis protein